MREKKKKKKQKKKKKKLWSVEFGVLVLFVVAGAVAFVLWVVVFASMSGPDTSYCHSVGPLETHAVGCADG